MDCNINTSSTNIDDPSRTNNDSEVRSRIGQRPRATRNIATSLRFVPVPAMAVAGFLTESNMFGSRGSPFRASYHGKSSEKQYDTMIIGNSIDNKRSIEVVGSAESLVGRVLQQEGLGKYCDPGFLRATQRELAEAFNMTSEELDIAAHQILEAEKRSPMKSSILSTNGTPVKSSMQILKKNKNSKPFISSSSEEGEEEGDKYKDTKL